MLGASILTLIGDTELLVENYRGILEYTQECILLQGKHTRIRIEGCCLKIVYYTNEDMKIAGKISRRAVSVAEGMPMIALIRYCRGYVRISVRGYAPERFMNLCANRAIVLWELNGHDGFYTMCISLSDFFKIRDIVHKTKTRVAVLGKKRAALFSTGCPAQKNVLARGFFMQCIFNSDVAVHLGDGI